MKNILLFSRFLIGAVFLFSGFVKGVDPLGTAYKIEEYLLVFGMDWALPLALIGSILLCSIEFLIGFCLVFNLHPKITKYFLLFFMLGFTVLTFIDALSNKVSDCGCFGDAIKLTNWETFFKNVVLLIFALFLFFYQKKDAKKTPFETDTLLASIGLTLIVAFCLFNFLFEPVIDFRPWKKGNEMMAPSKERGKVQNFLTYKNNKTGELIEMRSEDRMKYDSIVVNDKKVYDPSWAENHTWVKTRTLDPNEIRADGFSMLGSDGVNYDRDIIGRNDYVFILTLYDLKALKEKQIKKIKQLFEESKELGISLVLLTSSNEEAIQAFLETEKLEEMEYYFADEKAIKTMLRSNPGLILLKDALVLEKWSSRRLPQIDRLSYFKEKRDQ